VTRYMFSPARCHAGVAGATASATSESRHDMGVRKVAAAKVRGGGD
jgi:hypothetical protein